MRVSTTVESESFTGDLAVLAVCNQQPGVSMPQTVEIESAEFSLDERKLKPLIL